MKISNSVLPRKSVNWRKTVTMQAKCPICTKEVEIRTFGNHLRECNKSNGCAVTKDGTKWYCKLHEVSFANISEHVKQYAGVEKSNLLEKNVDARIEDKENTMK